MDYCKRIKLRLQKEGLIKTIEYILCVVMHQFLDCICITWLDLRYSRRLLRGNIKTSYKHLGANDVYHTKYCVMPLIFKLAPIGPKDVLVDVGCGKGRVINYWLSKKIKNKIYGLELDKNIAGNTANQFRNRKNVRIIAGDAITNLPSDATVFYFYNPFSAQKVEQFEEKLSRMFAGKSIRVIYYNPKSIHVFRNGRWNIRFINFEKDLGIRRWGRINKFHELAILTLKV
jgi:hypothetical protein